jgi:hypothetical protein
MNRFAVVEHFAFSSLYTLADFENLIVIDPYTDERIKYNDKETMETAWNVVEWHNPEFTDKKASDEWVKRMEYNYFQLV